MTHQHQQSLALAGTGYIQARLAIADTIVAAQSAGLDIEEIAPVTGLSRAEIEALLGDPA